MITEWNSTCAFPITGMIFKEVSKHDMLRIVDKDGNDVIRIASDGAVFWYGREVETDDDFRSAMLELRDYLMGKTPC